MKKLIFLIVLAIGVSHLAEAQSKSGYQIQGARKKTPGRSGSGWTEKVFFQPNEKWFENQFHRQRKGHYQTSPVLLI